jgi:transcriptional antiterminator RfaH
MSSRESWEALSWYVIHTHPKQEDRAEQNLKAWNVETFTPKFKELHYDAWTKKSTYKIKPLFPRYIFARFKAGDHYHKISYTRGVRTIVCFGGDPAPVLDEVIQIIQFRMTRDGFVRMEDELNVGDEVLIQEGPLKGITGVFDREMKEADRVRILLSEANFQGHILVQRADIRKVMKANHAS